MLQSRNYSRPFHNKWYNNPTEYTIWGFIMSENDFDKILNDVKKRANARLDIDPPVKSPSQQGYRDLLNCENSNSVEIHTSRAESNKSKKKNNKNIITAIIVVIIIAIAAAGAYFALSNSKSDGTSTANQSANIAENKAVNPLTGESGFNQAAVGRQPVAVVAENEYSTPAVRPQWGLNDADIVIEGESEYSTRLLLLWADYTSVPDMVGPVRSARPPFIKFSQLFDSVFIHAGLSKSKGSYVGADSIFKTENVDHINLLELSEDGKYFGRNNERNTSMEHTGYLNGSNLPELLKEKGIDTALNNSSFSALNFSDKPAALSNTQAEGCSFTWSEVCPKTAEFIYSSSSHKYETKDFDSQYGKANAEFENLILLFDQTQYIVKEDYKNGASETYCDYKLAGGSGMVLSEGTAIEITWGVTDGKLWLRTSDGKDISLNQGKSYIGYGSENNGGSLKLNFTEKNGN